MATTIPVLYENVEDATFDLDYYMAKHMPLVGEKFTPFGLKNWRVLKAVGGKQAYSIIANLEFDTAHQFKAAVAAEGGPVSGDVPNFSNKQPVVVIGDLVGAAPYPGRLPVAPAGTHANALEFSQKCRHCLSAASACRSLG